MLPRVEIGAEARANMYAVRADLGGNRFEMTVAGRLTPEQVNKLAQEALGVLDKLRPGFVAAIDISEMGVALSSDLEFLSAVQARLVQARPARIGTLVGSALVQMQVERVGRTVGVNDLARRFSDREAWREYVG
jgi:hypothetical protein